MYYIIAKEAYHENCCYRGRTLMLQLKNIIKTYMIGELHQDALKDVSISFRENEFVSILGQSGSGKTTLLNIGTKCNST